MTMKNIHTLILMLGMFILNTLNLQAQCNPDITPPEADCLVIAVNVGANGEVVVWASDFNANSTDNCTASDSLLFAFDRAGTVLNQTFQEGTFNIDIYVFDESGNVDSCSSSLTVRCSRAIACNDRVGLFLAPGEDSTIHVQDVLEGGGYCSDMVFSFSDTDPNDTLKTFTGDEQYPQTLVIYDVTSGNSCWSEVWNCHNVGPVAVANPSLYVSVDRSGQFRVQIGMIDQGSFSPCGPVDLSIRRFMEPGECELSNEWREEVLVCCKDIGDTVLIELGVTDIFGKQNSVVAEVIVEDPAGNFTEDCGSIEGQVYIDIDDDCMFTNGEDSARGVLIVATDGVEEFLTYSNHNGQYRLFLRHGDFDVFAVSPGYLWSVCPNFVQVTVDSANSSLYQDFGLKEAVPCPLMNVSITASRYRRCFENPAFINYVNTGPAVAMDARIELMIDTDLELRRASVPYNDLGNNTYEFLLGDVKPFEEGRISLGIYVDCMTTLGATKCMTAQIFPDTLCGELLNWSGADVEVAAQCEEDSIRFEIKNLGIGDMAEERSYEVIEDDVIMFVRTYQLNEDESMTFTVPANGSTFRLNAEEEINHPYPGIESVALEGCANDSSVVSLGFVNQFPFGDGDPFSDVECLQVIGSYDPNEKAASPLGYGPEHYLEPGNRITYTLYFQNTGTDTAFNVFLLDTLSEHLDLTTFEPGPASHDYEVIWQEGSAVRFDFPNIMLPDSFVNEPASNGFVQFSIMPKEDLELPAWIFNKVGIYFDFNEPVITNTVYHTIDTGFLKVVTSVDWWAKDIEEVEVSPNPSSDWVKWKWDADKEVEGRLEILDLMGKTVMSTPIRGSEVKMNVGQLSSGHYLFKITDRERLFSSGKILVKRR
jgi:uncharacterized repeat protein (TIGR01451 family)